MSRGRNGVDEMSETLLAKDRQRCGDAVENAFDVDHVLPVRHTQVGGFDPYAFRSLKARPLLRIVTAAFLLSGSTPQETGPGRAGGVNEEIIGVSSQVSDGASAAVVILSRKTRRGLALSVCRVFRMPVCDQNQRVRKSGVIALASSDPRALNAVADQRAFGRGNV
jgi:hypothetical protein